EGDWVCKNKETKEKLGELFFDADAGVLMGWLGTKNNEVIFDVSDSELTMFQGFLTGSEAEEITVML
ncbi:MAG: hypothetical protein ACRC6E_03025, partial [Fusobacteriaceae bacterium]